MQYEYVPFSSILGKTIVAIDGKVGDDVVTFIDADGGFYRMIHHQDCCEHVRVEDITGDLQDLIGLPLLQAEEVTSTNTPEDGIRQDESCTWTFYKLGTNKGRVTIRWLGSSNGYYSESVSFERLM